MAYLMKIARGKENLIGSILKKHGLEVHSIPEKGFLVCNNRPSPQLLFELKTYIRGVIEITGEETERLLHPKEKSGEEIKAGSLVEITSGVYKDFKGIVRRLPAPCPKAMSGMDSMAVVDLSILGRVFPVEVLIDEMRLSGAGAPWV